MTSVALVGSTGSIGTQTLDVIARHPEEFTVTALGAWSSVELLAAQAKRFLPAVVAIGDEHCSSELAPLLPPGTELVVGVDALSEIASLGEVCVNGVVGFAGLSVTIAALSAGRRLALANKESLIAGAPVVQVARATPGAEIVPVDSEHCAIHQCLGQAHHRGAVSSASQFFDPPAELNRLILTASGGPFRGWTADQLRTVTREQALSHPTWKMGPKITVDSSTLMNKGLEVIEAHELFGVDYDRIAVVIHPQSIIHSMVEWCDGATIAQLSNPDMRLPIGYALSYPRRYREPFGAIDWTMLSELTFAVPDETTFSCLALAYAAGREGGSAPAWLNAANEVAVEAFLAGRIAWSEIADIVSETLSHHEATKLVTVADVLDADAEARRVADGVAKAAIA
jgi:1-deoxy-D-xylulose-5-phosphate reductoisomerase